MKSILLIVGLTVVAALSIEHVVWGVGGPAAPGDKTFEMRGGAMILKGAVATTQPGDHGDLTKAHTRMMAATTTAVAVLGPTEGSSARGVVTFSQHGDHVQIRADIEGLSSNQLHAIHVHEFGDLRAADGTGAGGHYNPEGHDHALPAQAQRHAGDLGNLEADDSGRATLSLTVDNLSIAGLRNPVLGRGVIVHAKVDDGGQPTGNAGARIAMGVIGVAKPSE